MLTNKKENTIEYIYVACFFGFIMMWMMIQPFGVSPDEQMRYLVPQFIYNHGCLPNGGDPEIRNLDWGISYGFTPITSYIISALFMKIASVFSTDAMFILGAARMVNVLFGTATVYIIIRIGKKIFRKPYDWLFIVCASAIPQFVFVNSYVNMDSIALFGAALLFYVCILGRESKWSYKHSVYFAISLSVCLLSYYNTYGLIMCYSIYYLISYIMWHHSEKKWGLTLLKKGLLIVGIVFILCGWWFIRNAILYNGDFLGLKTSNEFGEKYGIDSLKPSKIVTPLKERKTVYEMLRGGWVTVTAMSFFGIFGAMDILLINWVYHLYFILIIIGIFGVFISIIRHLINKKGKDTLVFAVCSLGAIISTIGISVYYSYTNDYQPQGRYILPMMLPLYYFIVKGYATIIDLFAIRPVIRKILCVMGEIGYLLLLVYSYAFVFARAYR